MAIRAKFMGREKVAARLRKFVPDAEKQMAEAQIAAANELADAIRPRAPVDDGDYQQSIRGGRLADNPGAAVFGLRETKDKNATGIFASFLWRWLEFGTNDRTVKKTGAPAGKMPAQPHIMPTWRQHQKRIRRKVAGALNRAIKRGRGK